jgi:hypothetical protein
MLRMHLPVVHPPCAERIKAKTANAAKANLKTK